jgi:hypothetical protein
MGVSHEMMARTAPFLDAGFAGLRLAAVAGEVIHIEIVKPGGKVFAGGGSGIGKLTADELARLVVGGRGRLADRAPLRDLPLGALERRLVLNPCQNGSVSEPFGHLGFEVFGIDAGEFEKPLIERAVVMILAARAGQFGTAFVEHPGEEHIAAEADTGTAGWALGQVHGISSGW